VEYSRTGEQLTEHFEGCRLTAYQDVKGLWTIGVGHTGPEVCEGLVWTQEQADAQLLKDIQNAVDHVNRLVTVPLTQDEFDALVDFIFNVGSGNFDRSALLRLLNAGDYQGAAAQFDLWDHAGGKVVAGLLRRREAEKAEFNGI
jgi:lysozyme